MLWNYNVQVNLEGIQRGQVPLTWFTASTVWDAQGGMGALDSHGQLYVTGMEETRIAAGGLIRVGVAEDAAPLTWNEYFNQLDAKSRKEMKARYRATVSQNSRPADWRFSAQPVPVEKILTIEAYNGMAWVPLAEANRHTVSY